MTKEELIQIREDGTNLLIEVLKAALTGKITKLEFILLAPYLKHLAQRLSLLNDKINSINDVEYSIAVCDCCQEEYILETHISSKGEIVEEKPFDFTESTPAEIFKMGFDSCLKQD